MVLQTFVAIATGMTGPRRGHRHKLTGAKVGDAIAHSILENCMARGRALYDGHAVAAVAAVDTATAKKYVGAALLTS